MFEAHNLSLDELQDLLQPAAGYQKTYHRCHLASLRPLRIWFAAGKRKDGAAVPHRTWFVYIEYRDGQGSNRYYCLERRMANASVEALIAEAVQAALPGLDAA